MITTDRPTPTWTKTCTCGATVSRYRGQGDVTCRCGQSFNAFGQMLRSGWQANPSNYDSEIGDMEGYEMSNGGDL